MARKPKSVTRTTSTKDITGRATATAIEVPYESDSDKSTKSLESFLQEMRDRFHECAESPNESSIRKSSLEDLKFYVGDQWDPGVRARVESRKRPVLTINRVKPACRQVINSLLQDRPSIKINPVDDKSDIHTAEILQGIIRHIETQSMADIAYDTALNGQVIHGFGYVEVETDFPTPYSFNQEAYIRAVDDPFSVYLGPHKEIDDMNYAFRVWDYAPDEYAARFGSDKSKFSGLQDFTAVGNSHPGWGTKSSIRVVKYYYRTFRDATIALLSDGSVMEKSDIPSELLEVSGIVDERDTQLPEVHICIANGVEKLEEYDWNGMYIPLIPVWGDKQIVDGRVIVTGIVHDAINAQQQLNYLFSKTTETIAIAPTAPYVMAEGQDEGHEREWETANIENYARLYYKPKTISGQLVPPPQRTFGEPPIQALLLALQHYEDALKATTQVHDAKLGAKSNETSGRAIATRKAQSDTANYTFANNFIRSLRWIGVILLDLIPRIYDARTIARIIGEDNQASKVSIINEPNQPAYRQEPTEDGGIERIYNLGVGQYDVAVGIGPNYLTKRQEAFDMLTKLVNSWPELMKIGGDVVMANSDIPGSQQLSKRLKKVLEVTMPGVTDDDPNAVPPKVQAVIKQLMQEREMMVAQIEQLTQQQESKSIETSGRIKAVEVKAASDEHIAALQAQVKAVEIASKADMEEAKAEREQVKTAMEVQKMAMEKQRMAMDEQSGKLDRTFSLLETMIATITKPGPVEGSTTS